MPARRNGIPSHQSSARLSDLRSGRENASYRSSAYNMVRAATRFLEGKRSKKPKRVDLGARVTLDDERCILCSRCIRFMKEVAKDDVLGFASRGSHTYLTAYPGRQTG